MRRHGMDSVREQLWFLGHDDYGDLRPIIDRRALGIGLAAAALVDLLLQGLIEIEAKHGLIYRTLEPLDDPGVSRTAKALDDPGVYRTTQAPGPAEEDPIGNDILSLLGRGPAPRLVEVLHEARAEPFGNTHTPFQRLYQRTRGGLLRAGYLQEQPRRILPNLYLLNDSALISSIRGDFSHRLAMRHKIDVDLASDSLFALVWALNLHLRLPMAYSPSEAAPVMLAITEEISDHAPLTVLPDLAHLVRSTVGDLATSAF